MVHSIVRQNRGIIEVQSEPGTGTTFNIYFSRSHGKPEKINEQLSIGLLNCNATVLVVEDRADLLESAKKGLEQYGYKVLAALSPQEALTVCKNFQADIDLLLADVIMPNMNGGELSRRIREMKPKIRTVFMSGYAADVLAPRGAVGKGVAFIQKPFTPQALAKKLQEVLSRA
jgi:CheY-like chemotaxis protein